MFLLMGHYDFTQHAVQNLMRPNIVYVPINWSLRFYAARCTKSNVIPDIVYVPINWSLRLYTVCCTKSYAILTHIVCDFEYIGTLPLSYMLLTLLRLRKTIKVILQ